MNGWKTKLKNDILNYNHAHIFNKIDDKASLKACFWP